MSRNDWVRELMLERRTLQPERQLVFEAERVARWERRARAQLPPPPGEGRTREPRGDCGAKRRAVERAGAEQAERLRRLSDVLNEKASNALEKHKEALAGISRRVNAVEDTLNAAEDTLKKWQEHTHAVEETLKKWQEAEEHCCQARLERKRGPKVSGKVKSDGLESPMRAATKIFEQLTPEACRGRRERRAANPQLAARLRSRLRRVSEEIPEVQTAEIAREAPQVLPEKVEQAVEQIVQAALAQAVAALAAAQISKGSSAARLSLSSAPRDGEEPIAVLGAACHMLGGSWTPESFAATLLARAEIPHGRWDSGETCDPEASAGTKMYVRHGGSIEGGELFAAAQFNIVEPEVEAMDPEQRHLLEVSFEAFLGAKIEKSTLMWSPTGVFLGQGKCDWNRVICGSQSGLYAATGGSSSISANRISYVLGLRGPSATIDTACSSALVAADTAASTLRRGRADLATVCGVNMLLLPHTFAACCQAHVLSAGGRCRTFDSTASGHARAEGAGAQTLERIGDKHALAELRGSALNQDGRSSNLTAPSGPSQLAVVREALSEAGTAPSALHAVETRGTGTQLGDPIEFGAVHGVLGGSDSRRPVMLGAVKSNIGHLEGGAGLAGLTKLVAMSRRMPMPANLHLRDLNGHILENLQDFQVGLPTETVHLAEKTTTVSVSSFGFGGTNGHVVLQVPPQPEPPRWALEAGGICGPPTQTQVGSPRCAAEAAVAPRGTSGAAAGQHPGPLPPGQPEWYEWNPLQHKFYCRLCCSFADEGHVRSEGHLRRARWPDWNLSSSRSSLIGSGPRALPGSGAPPAHHGEPPPMLLTGKGSQYASMSEGLCEAEGHAPSIDERYRRKRHEQFVALLEARLPAAPGTASSAIAEQALHRHPAAQQPDDTALSDGGWEECRSPVQIEASAVSGGGMCLASVDRPPHVQDCTQAGADVAHSALRLDDSASSVGSWEECLDLGQLESPATPLAAPPATTPAGTGASAAQQLDDSASSVDSWEECLDLLKLEPPPTPPATPLAGTGASGALAAWQLPPETASCDEGPCPEQAWLLAGPAGNAGAAAAQRPACTRGAALTEDDGPRAALQPERAPSPEDDLLECPLPTQTTPPVAPGAGALAAAGAQEPADEAPPESDFVVTQPACSVPCLGDWAVCVGLRQAAAAHGQLRAVRALRASARREGTAGGEPC